MFKKNDEVIALRNFYDYHEFDEPVAISKGSYCRIIEVTFDEWYGQKVKVEGYDDWVLARDFRKPVFKKQKVYAIEIKNAFGKANGYLKITSMGKTLEDDKHKIVKSKRSATAFYTKGDLMTYIAAKGLQFKKGADIIELKRTVPT